MNNFKENIRLIIWDLDETFWNGTLTEGGVSFIEDNEKLVISLAKRGVMSSICSKNNEDDINKILKERGLLDYFIFNSINWNPKASRVKNIIENIGLRPESVLFIDDNMQNLNQAKALLPNLNISLPDIIKEIKNSPYFQGKDDSNLSRLKQYKINEEKKQIKNDYVSNIDFLKESNITIELEHDIQSNIDRAIELINRTNQLNFTKKRLPEDINEARKELTITINKNTNFSALIKVKDKFGDYGFVGFVSINRINKEYICEHFCFPVEP